MTSAPIEAADLFCGAGGTSRGLADACALRGRKLRLRAVNHWPLAVETHAANHPDARHWCEPIDSIDPRKAVPAGRLDLLWASPECTHHSNARGGKPCNDQSRASAWCVLRWATALRIDNILVENVPEFATWGPLGADGRPLRRRRGETFGAFLAALRSLGFRVDWRVLNAADYGDPTTRQRLFVQARRGRRPISWPAQTHSAEPGRGLFGETLPWRAAREVIDWDHKGASIFARKKPLSENTLARIAAGLRRFGGAAAAPFLVMLYGSNTARSLERPLPTVTAAGQHIGLCEPFVLPPEGIYRGNAPRSVEDPLPTITSRGGGTLVQPFIVHSTHGGERRPNGIDEPLPTVTGAHRGEMALVEPFVMQMSQSGSNGRRMRKDSQPLPTITTADDLAIVEPFLVNYHGNGRPHPVSEPIRTLDTNDRYGLVEAVRLDILFRMLSPKELARAMSFPDGYEFRGNRENVVKQIGNAVPVRLARALCEAVLFDAA